MSDTNTSVEEAEGQQPLPGQTSIYDFLRTEGKGAISYSN